MITVAASNAPARIKSLADYVCDGVADETEINAAIALGAGEVKLSTGTFNITNGPIILAANVWLRGSGAATTIKQMWWGGELFQALGATASTTVRLTANAIRGQRKLTVGSTSGIFTGDTFVLGSNEVFSDPPDNTSGDQVRYRGELVQVESVVAPNTVNLFQVIRDTYATSASASLEKPTWIDGIRLSDFAITNGGTLGASNKGFTWLRACRNFRIHDIDMTRCDSSGMYFDTCFFGWVDRIRGFDYSTAGGAYGMQVYGACEQIIISNSHWRRTSVAFTTGGANNRRGVPRNILVKDCTADGCKYGGFNTHAQGSLITFSNCSAQNITQGYGFEIRSPNTRLVGCQTDMCAHGFFLDRCAHGSVVDGGTFKRNIRTESFGGYGGWIRRAKSVTVKGVTVDMSSRSGILIDAGSDNALIQNCDVWNSGTDGTAYGAIWNWGGTTGSVGVRILDNTTGDRKSVEPGSFIGKTWCIVDNDAPNTKTVIGGNRSVSHTGNIIEDAQTGTIKFANINLSTGT